MAGKAWIALVELLPQLGVVGCSTSAGSGSSLTVVWLVKEHPDLVAASFLSSTRCNDGPSLALPPGLESLREVSIGSYWMGRDSGIPSYTKLFKVEMRFDRGGYGKSPMEAVDYWINQLQQPPFPALLDATWIKWIKYALYRERTHTLRNSISRENETCAELRKVVGKSK